MNKTQNGRRKLVWAICLIIAMAVILSAIILVSAATADGAAEWYGSQVTTDGNINLRFYYKLTGDVTRARVTIADPETGDGTWYYANFQQGSGGLSYVNVPLAAAQMTYEVSVCPLVAKTTTAAGEQKTLSIREYANKILAHSDDAATEEIYASHRDAMKAILNYGAMAQERFEIAESELANEGIYSRGTNPIDTLVIGSVNATTSSQTGSALSYSDRVIFLESNISLRINFTYTGSAPLNATVSRTDSGASSPAYSVADTVRREEGTNTYYVEIFNIPTTYYNSEYKVTITDGSNSVTVKTSILDCVNQLSKSSSEQDVNVALSIYNYYKWTTKVSTEGCTHQNVHFEAVEVGADVSQAVCSNCGTEFGHQVPDSVNYYSAPNVYGNQTGTQGISLGFKNGTAYSTVTGSSGAGSNAIVNLVANGSNKVESLKTSINSGKYFVLKIKSSQNVSKIAIMAANSAKATMNAKDIDESYVTMHVSGNGEQLFVVDIEKCALGNTFLNYATDEDNVKNLFATLKIYNAYGIETSAKGSVDIEYFAICDDWSEIAKIAGADNSGDYVCSYYVSDYEFDTVVLSEDGDVCDELVLVSRTNKQIKYQCTRCNEIRVLNISEDTNFLNAAGEMKVSNSWAGSTDGKIYLDADNDVIYQRMNIYGNSSASSTQYGWGATIPLTSTGDIDTFDAIKGGSGKYAVFKIRTHNVATISIKLASRKEGDTTTAPDYYQNMRGWEYNDQWVTVAVDISALETSLTPYSINDELVKYITAGLKFKKGTYTGSLPSTSNYDGQPGYVDIAYFSIVDDLYEVEDVVQNGKYYLTNWRNDAAFNAYTATPSASISLMSLHTCDEYTLISKTERYVEYQCTECDEIYVLDMADSTNFFNVAGNFKVTNSWQGKTDGKIYLDADNDVIYQRMNIYGNSIASNTQYGWGSTIAFTSGGDLSKFDTISGNSGKYVVFKFRTHNVATICIMLGSRNAGDTSTTVPDWYQNIRGWTYNDQWVTVAVDITALESGATPYTVNSDLVNAITAGFKFKKGTYTGTLPSSTNYDGQPGYIDVSYFAIVDSIDEVDTLVHNGQYFVTTWRNDATLVPYTATPAPDTDGGTNEDVMWGADLGDSFANTAQTIPSTYTTMTAANMLTALKNGTLTRGAAYKVTEALTLSAGTTYNGNGAFIIADGGVKMSGISGTNVKDVVIVGNVSITSSSGLTFNKVYVDSSSTAISIDENSTGISFRNCRIIADQYAIQSNADEVVLYSSYVYSGSGIAFTGDSCIVQNCHVQAIGAGKSAISSKGNACIFRNNTIKSYYAGIVIRGEDNAPVTNVLIALNEMSKTTKSIILTKCYNISVTLNNTETISASENTNIYLIENTVASELEIKNNNYVIAESNKYKSLVNSANTNTNGNTITDVDARADVGANEDILPHTNKDLFVGMDRNSVVADAQYSSLILDDYVTKCAREDSVVIVPPGVYNDDRLNITDAHSNTTIYAYGVYFECVSKTGEMDPTQYTNSTVYAYSAKNVSLYGLTVGYDFPSCAQVRVVNKYVGSDGSYNLVVVNDAGFLEGFGKTNTSWFYNAVASFFLYDENTKQVPLYPEEDFKSRYNIVDNGDGTMTMTLTASSISDEYGEYKPLKDIYDRITVGSIGETRIASIAGATMAFDKSHNISMKDTVVYGYSGGLSVTAGGTSSGISFERHHNTAHNGYLIDKATYDKYVALETQYGVDFDVYSEVVNGVTRYRGATPRGGSVDGFHINTCQTGVSLTSCLLENMVDDGANQRSGSSRLHGYKDNGDGTTTFYYKNMVTQVGFSNSSGSSLNTVSCVGFSQGDHIYIYSASGEVVCDTITLSATAVHQSSYTISLTYSGVTRSTTVAIYAITVNTRDVNFDALINPESQKAYDLTDNRYELDNKVFVDNLSYNSANWTADNVLIQNARVRGFLVKSPNVTIKHCTFRNLPHAGIMLKTEPIWGESTVVRNLRVYSCLFDHTGFMYGDLAWTEYSPITTEHVNTYANEDDLMIDNITIDGCEFRNVVHKISINLTDAKNVRIRNNVFGGVQNETDRTKGVAIYLDSVANVEISGNTYNHSRTDITQIITGDEYINVYGSDVTDASGNPIFQNKQLASKGDGVINYNANLDSVGMAWSDSTYRTQSKTENGISYVRCDYYKWWNAATNTTATFLTTGKNKGIYTTTTPINSGKYLVIKFKGSASNDAFAVKIMLASNYKNTATTAIDATGYIDRGINKANGYFTDANTWHVVVIKLDNSWNTSNDYAFTPNAEITALQAGFQLNTVNKGDYFDLALFALCDSWAEIDSLVTEEYCDYSPSGTTIYKNIKISDNVK